MGSAFRIRHLDRYGEHGAVIRDTAHHRAHDLAPSHQRGLYGGAVYALQEEGVELGLPATG